MSIAIPKNHSGAKAPAIAKPLPIRRSRVAVWARRLAVSVLLLGGCGERALFSQGHVDAADAAATDPKSDAPVDCASIKPLECSNSGVYEEYLAKGSALAFGQYRIVLDAGRIDEGMKVARITVTDSCGKMLFIGGVRQGQTIFLTLLSGQDMEMKQDVEITAPYVSTGENGKPEGALILVRAPCRDDAGITHWCELTSGDLGVNGFLSIGTFSVAVDAVASDASGNLFATIRVRAPGGALLHESDIYPGGYSIFDSNGILYRIDVPEITADPQTGGKSVRVELYQGGITLCGDAGSLER